MAWPSATEEIWRYSRIGDLDLDDLTPAAAATSVEAPGEESAFVTVPAAGGPVAGLVDGPPPDVFAELNAAFAAPVQVTVPAGAYVAQPIVVTHHVDTDGSAVFPRLLVDAGEDCEVTVVERFVGSGRALVAPVLHLRAGRAAACATWPSTSCRSTPGRSATSWRSETPIHPPPWRRWPSAATMPGSAPRCASPDAVATPSRSRCTSPAASR